MILNEAKTFLPGFIAGIVLISYNICSGTYTKPKYKLVNIIFDFSGCVFLAYAFYKFVEFDFAQKKIIIFSIGLSWKIIVNCLNKFFSDCYSNSKEILKVLNNN